MYKIYAIYLALIVPAGAYATTGTPQITPDKDATGPLQSLFDSTGETCSHINRADLAKGGMLENFYAKLDYQPQWQSAEQRERLHEQLRELRHDGLTPEHYSVNGTYEPVCQEVLISQRYLQALNHLSRGKVEQDQVDRFWRDPNSSSIDPRPSTLSLAWQGLENLSQAFSHARPKAPQYARLREAYVNLSNRVSDDLPPLPAGPSLRPGMSDSRVPQLRQRLQAEGYLTDASGADSHTLYSPELISAVELFQQRHKLQADGIVGPATLAALNVNQRQRLQQLRANLERWRWLEGDIEDDSLLVDIVGSTMTVYQNGEQVWHTRTQVGRPGRQTPRLKSVINQLTLNPTWTVPPTILRQDKLPAIRRDPSFVARNNMRLLDRQGNTLDPYNVDWSQPVTLRQAAGPSNPLGKLVIRFPNPFSVYLHDTPSQHLFSRTPRTVSSGCVRVEGIQSMLPLMFDDEQSQAISSRIKRGRTEQVPYSPRLTVLLGYWTAEVSDDGQLILRSDPYNLDPALLRALDQAPRQSSALTQLTQN